MSTSLLEVKDIKKYFPINNGLFKRSKSFVKAVDGVSFTLEEGDTLGLVGESGCGKSTTGRSILRLIEPSSGSVTYKGEEVTSMSKNELRKIRKNMQIVFQDPYASLNPRIQIGSILEEALSTHKIGQNAKERKSIVIDLLQKVGLNKSAVDRYPHEFSGGQRQRIGIARAIAVNPSLIVADEPVSALDVSIQAQILNLFQDLQEQMGLTYIFIAHDLSVVKHISNKIGVMYLGKMVEFASKEQLFSNPSHPYTQALMSAVPIPNPTIKKERIILNGDVPNPSNPPTGCTFHPRCQACMKVCKEITPKPIEISPGHVVSCHLFDRNMLAN
ncbi:MAG TPA: dipeptide ABC transporter ATP-binding protein [Bacillus sp. (in: firmicutes)]|uniref:ABC transporter ATP-binding protein n=1 Tax=Bacillus litorisediminis TaxID=2922713 RepID=UPI001FAF8DEF|nr:dipeptide ABC transporter ATP-binding protein [Bacillus litorisediminis]HWO76144.1 dipeptide ABC transporter ATP-binding protein [Bacillus sp. (in: firmicutes)]